MNARFPSALDRRGTLLRMARGTDVGGGAISGLWRRPLAGGRSIDGWLETQTERLLQAIAQRPVRLAIILLVCNRAIGGALYSVTEPDSDWFDGAWWVLVTQTTVGYGDFAPESFLGRATAELVMWTGILAVAILTAALAGVIAERRIEQARNAPITCEDGRPRRRLRSPHRPAGIGHGVSVRAPATPEGRHQRPARRRRAAQTRTSPKEKGL